MKMPAVMIAAVVALSGCAVGPWDAALFGDEAPGWDQQDFDTATARLTGTVWDRSIDAPAQLEMYSDYGYTELVATTDSSGSRLSGMTIFSSDLEFAELVDGGSRQLDADEGYVALCGSSGWDSYDEEADDVEIVVEDEEDGEIGVLLRGSTRNGRRFQEVRFTLDAETMAPVY